MNFTKSSAAVFLAIVLASVTMMVVETINSFLFPFPPGLDTMDLVAVQAFAHTLPAVAFWVVIFGWALGSFVGGVVVTTLAEKWGSTKKDAGTLAWGTGVVLLMLGILNSFVILPGIHPLWFHFVSLPMLVIGSVAGNRALQ